MDPSQLYLQQFQIHKYLGRPEVEEVQDAFCKAAVEALLQISLPSMVSHSYKSQCQQDPQGRQQSQNHGSQVENDRLDLQTHRSLYDHPQ